MNVRLARRPRPAPEPVAAGRMPWREVPRSHRPPHLCRWPGWDHCCIPWLGGRPSPTWGHARPGRDRHRRVPTQLSGGSDHPQQQANHRLVAALPTVTCSCPGPGGLPSISQRAHTIGGSPYGPRPDRSAPARVPAREARQCRSDLPSPSPTDQREGGRRPRQPRQLAHNAAAGPGTSDCAQPSLGRGPSRPGRVNFVPCRGDPMVDQVRALAKFRAVTDRTYCAGLAFGPAVCCPGCCRCCCS
jgi:hypothetical protein